MLVYLLNILLIVIWAFVFHIGKKTKLKKILFVLICFVQCFLIAGFRYGIGFDYAMYASTFFKMVLDGFEKMTYYDWEIGYIFLNKIIGAFLSVRSSVMILVTSAISLIGPAYLIIRYSKNAFLSVFLYVNFFLFYLDMNFIRQAIAMSIICFAYGFLKEKKFWRYLLLVLIASTFHFTVLYMIPVYFICHLKVNSRTLLLYVFGLFFYFMISDGLMDFIFSRFHTEYSGSIFIEEGLNSLLAVIPVMFSIGAAVSSYFIKEKTRNLDMLIHLTLMMGFWQVVMTKQMLFERFSYYTMIFAVIAVPEIICALKGQVRLNLKEKNLLTARKRKSLHAVSKAIKLRTDVVSLGITAAVVILAFVYNMYWGLIIPENGAHGILPYQTRLNVEIPNIDSFFKDNPNIDAFFS